MITSMDTLVLTFIFQWHPGRKTHPKPPKKRKEILVIVLFMLFIPFSGEAVREKVFWTPWVSGRQTKNPNAPFATNPNEFFTERRDTNLLIVVVQPFRLVVQPFRFFFHPIKGGQNQLCLKSPTTHKWARLTRCCWPLVTYC